MMSKREINDKTVGWLTLLLFLLALHMLKGIFGLCEPGRPPYGEQIFVQISGDVRSPGVYGFCRSPGLKQLLIKAGGLQPMTEKGPVYTRVLYHSGVNVDVRSDGKEPKVFEGEMSAFYKITLGIPISLNRETLDGLTVLPGIGPKIAGAIVRERFNRGGFKRVDEILSVQGIGPTLYKKVSPYLVL